LFDDCDIPCSGGDTMADGGYGEGFVVVG